MQAKIKVQKSWAFHSACAASKQLQTHVRKQFTYKKYKSRDEQMNLARF